MKQLDWVRKKFGSIEEYIRVHFGREAKFSVVGDCCLVHLDNPDEATILEREQEFLKDDGLDDDCPLCQLQREDGGFVVYDGCEGWCPDCKQKDSCEVYASQEWDDNDASEVDSEATNEVNHNPSSPWTRSFVDMGNAERLPPSLATQIMLFGVLGHAAELRTDLQNQESDEALIRGLFEPLESACCDLKSFLSDDSQIFMPSGISVNLQLTISTLGKFAGGEHEHKTKDLIVKLEKLLDFVDRL
jgi:hypothetical protein